MHVYRLRFHAVAIACGILLSIASGCESKSGTGGSASSSSGTTPAPRTVASRDISDDEATLFAEQLEAAVSQGRASDMESVIDWTFLIGTTTSDLDVPDKFRADFQRGVTSTAQFSKQIAQTVAAGGAYKLIRVHDVDGQKRAFFRLTFPQGGGINFHDVVLRKREDGRIMIADIYVFLSGEMLSMTLRRTFIPAAAHENRNMLEKLSGKESDFVKHLADLQKISQSVASGKNQVALDTYYQMPDSLKNDTTLLLFRIRASQALDDAEYIKALEAFRTQYPKDSCVDFLSIDAHVLKGDFDKAIACVDRVNKAVEGDAALLCLKAQLYAQSSELEMAKETATDALRLEPNHVESHWMLVGLAVQDKDHAETARLLSKIESDLGIAINDLTGLSEYADFIRSTEYRNWRDSRQPR